VNTLKLIDNVWLVELPSELIDPDEIPYLNSCIPQVSNKKEYIIVDFSVVQKMNGLGATMLVKFGTLARYRGQCLLAIGVSDHYRDVLRLTGLDRIISIYGNREEALADIGVAGDNIPNHSSKEIIAQDMDYWAKPVIRLNIPDMPKEAINLNMNGRSVVGPVDGFGQLWQKRYLLRIQKTDLAPEDIILALKQNFPCLQPSYNRFYPTEKGIKPGEVIAIDSSTPGGPVSTGVMVLYADERSFSFITPQGHPESGWVSFSAFEANNQLIVQILGLARANDPLYEIAFRTVGSKMQVKIWKHLLSSLTAYLGILSDVTVEATCVDPRLKWTQVGNVWYNAQIRTMLYMPFRWLMRAVSVKSKG
jgi:anti-anti-sigma regulatory factor